MYIFIFHFLIIHVLTFTWINQIVKEIDVGSEVVINDIINECSKSDQWDDYVKPVYDWLFERRKI